jgi:hypothetical protein
MPMPATNGHGTAAWIDASDQVQLLRDEQSSPRAVATIPLPPPGMLNATCGGWALGGDRLATLCPVAFPQAPLRLLDLSSGTWSGISDEQPILATIADVTDSDDAFQLAGLGTHAVSLSSANRSGARVRVFSLQTGTRLAVSQGTRQTTGLDAPGGVAHLCAPLKVRTYVFNDYGTFEHLPLPVAYRTPLLATATRSVLLERCASRRVRVIGHSVNSNVIMTDRYIAWSDITWLYVYDLARHRTSRWRVPKSGGPPMITGTNRRIWIDATATVGQPLIYVLDLRR